VTRLIDIICGRCSDRILNARAWPAPRNCADCAGIAARHADNPGSNLGHLDGRESAAIHEAAHVVTGLACEYTICYASLEPSDRPGSGAHYVARIFNYQQGSSGHAVMGLAGSLATRRWVRSQGCTSDADMLEAINTGLSDVQEMYELGWSSDDLASRVPDAEAVVDLHWASIERVAEALLSAGRLEGDRIAELAALTMCAA
jgi:hypothetical protein